jgi:hypothetical protein
MTQQLVTPELVDEGVTVDHSLDWHRKRRRVETLRMSALQSVRVIPNMRTCKVVRVWTASGREGMWGRCETHGRR